MRICLDTMVLIYILKDEFKSFQDKVYDALAKKKSLVIPTVVFAELLPQFRGDVLLLKSFLNDHKIKIEDLDIKSTTIAAHKWMKYLERKTRVKCPHCKTTLPTKEHFLSDFFIGGFSLAKCEAIITKDRGLSLIHI